MSLSDQALYLRRANIGTSRTRITVGKGATYIDQVPEGLIEALTTIAGRSVEDRTFQDGLEERLTGQTDAGGQLAQDKAAARSPATIARWMIAAAVALAVFGAVALFKGKTK